MTSVSPFGFTNRSPARSIGCAILCAVFVAGGSVSAELVVQTDGPVTRLCLGSAAPFHETTRPVLDGRSILVENSTIEVITWREQRTDGSTVPWYAISPDGVAVPVLRETSYELKLRYAEFDPAVSQPNVSSALAADETSNVYVVQFVTQPLDEYRAALRARGAKVHNYLPRHAHLVTMTQAVKATVEALPFVRAIAPYHPAYRVSPDLRALLESTPASPEPERYSILVLERGLPQQETVIRMIESLGGSVEATTPGGFNIRAQLSLEQARTIARMNAVQFMDRPGEIVLLSDNAREISGANFLASLPPPAVPFTGTGVRGEVYDWGMFPGHAAFQHPSAAYPIVHCANLPGSPSHGTRVYGLVFGDGTLTPIPGASGILPDGEGLFISQPFVFADRPLGCGWVDVVTSELVGSKCCLPSDPNCPYDAVFRTSSMGSGNSGIAYTSTSALWDDALFKYDIVMCQAQGNAGATAQPRDSVSEAWAKNIVSVGGVTHLDTLCREDHRWCGCPDPTQQCPSPDMFCSTGCGSIGPPEDGRVKPDLVHFYDNLVSTCTLSPGCYTQPCGQQNWCTTETGCVNCLFEPPNSVNFGGAPIAGTSFSTPITCGYFGLMFEMWHRGVFPGHGGQATVFDSRPHMSTAKALMINSAYRYPLTQADFTRFNQGWGMVDVEKLHERAAKMFIVDESHVLGSLYDLFREFHVVVGPNEPELLVTMVYADPAGNPAANLARVNDLSVKLTSPSGLVYWGNHGLLSGNCSVADSDPANRDEINTVENVFVCPPIGQAFVEAGIWQVRVQADEINEDGNVRYLNGDPTECCVSNPNCIVPSEADADFALVVTGVTDLWGRCCLQPSGVCIDTTKTDCLQQGGRFVEGFTCASPNLECATLEE